MRRLAFATCVVLGCGSTAPTPPLAVAPAPPPLDAPPDAPPDAPLDAPPPPAVPLPALATFTRPPAPAGVLSIGFDAPADAAIRTQSGYFAATTDHLARDPDRTFVVALVGEDGAPFPTLASTARQPQAFAIAPPERRYTIQIENTSTRDLELLVSVGFIDVFTGAFNQGVGDDFQFSVRGALVAPGQRLQIIGIAQRTDARGALTVPPSPTSSFGSHGATGGSVHRGPTQVRIAAYARP